ncbi:MAG: hypothetical protein ACTSWX_00850 [Promethearchaeota archaeon]
MHKLTKKVLIFMILMMSFISAPVRPSKAAENVNYVTSYSFPYGTLVSGDIGSLSAIDSDTMNIQSDYIGKPLPAQLFCGDFYFPLVHADILKIKIIVPSSTDWFIDIVYSDGTVTSKSYQYNGWVEYSIQIDRLKKVDHIEISSFGDEYTMEYTVKIDQIVLISTYSVADLNILSPSEGELSGTIAPDYEIEISYQYDLDRVYYTLNNDQTKEYLVDITAWESGEVITGVIDDESWNDLDNGEVTITFTVITDLDTQTQKSVIIEKDTVAPSISIYSPEEGQKCGIIAPEFQIDVSNDSNIESKWYVVEDSDPIDFTLNFGTIDQNIWDNLIDSESITIDFYAKDLIGNVDKSSVAVSKDSTPPEIQINLPTLDQMFGNIPPTYEISINEETSEFGYKLDDGIEYQLTSTIGSIYQTSWESLDQGMHNLTFYAVDDLGNKGFSTINIYKDSISPYIEVNDPIADNVYGLIAPNYSLNIVENNLQDFGYYIDGSSNFFIENQTGRIDQHTWDLLDEGTHSIDFWARDLAGNVQYSSKFISKDTKAPIININSPFYGIYGENVPYYDIDVFDQNPDEVWYTINNNSSSKFYISSATGFIDQDAYNNCGEGEILITFFASDIVGNIAQSGVYFIKDTIYPEISVISPKIEDSFGKVAPFFEINVIEDNLNELYYRVNDGTYRVISEFEGFINQNDWKDAPCGEVCLKFIAIDSIGHQTINEIVVNKDTISPLITIISPNNDQINGIQSPFFEIEINEPNLKSVWYTLNSNSTVYDLDPANLIDGCIDQDVYNGLHDGIVIINFFSEDNLGNIGSSSVSIIKDSISPKIDIISPIPNNFYGDHIYYDLEIDELYLSECYYTINANLTRFPLYEPKGYIDLDLWNSLEDGIINITFSASDLAGNNACQTISLIKDTTDPIIEIISPLASEKFNSSLPPTFILNITEENFDIAYYTIGNSSETHLIQNNSNNFTIDNYIWRSLSFGNIEITIFVRDLSNHTIANSIIVEKIDIEREDNPDIKELIDMPIPVSLTIISGVAIIIVIANKIRKRNMN